jgi:hypothetical protein
MYERRPTEVTLIAVLFFLGGAAAILGGVYVLAVPIPSILSMLATYQVTIGIVAVVIGLIDVIVGWGLWTLKEWSRITAIVILSLGAIQNLFAGVGMLVGIDVMGYPISAPGPGIVSILTAGFQGWIIWYLLKPETMGIFQRGVSMPPTVSAPSPPVRTARPASPAPPEPTVPQRPSPRPSVASHQPPRQPTMPVAPKPAPSAWLVLRVGPRAGQQFGLQRGRNTVGRDPSKADILIEDNTVSGEHARVKFEQGRFYVYDLASTNGTYVNNRRIQRSILMDNDKVRFGNMEMVFKHVG